MFSKACWSLALPVTLLVLAAAAPQPAEKFSELRKVTLDTGVTLHYVERGKGEPIIFIHGASADYRVWEDWLADFAGEYRLIAYSRRYNYPNDNKPEKNHSAAVEAADLAAFVKKLALDKVHLVGHSYGAYTALLFALQHPDRVRTLTLAEPPVFSWLSDLPGDRAKRGKEMYAWWVEQGRLAGEALRAGDREKAFSYLPFGLSPKTPEARRQQIMDNAREAEAILTTNNIFPKVDREQVKKIQAPTLFLAGEKIKEGAGPLWLVMEELERLVPEGKSKRAIIPGAGHLMWLDRPKESNQALLEFLQGK